MGEIYLANDRVNGKQVAIKLMAIEDPQETKLLKSEIDIGLSLKHGNIIEAFYANTTEIAGIEFFYQSMEFHKSGNLRNALGAYIGPIPLPDCYKLMIDLTNGLQYAHQRIVHRDLKPENILVGNDGSYKICDFGLAKYVDNKTRTHTLKGSGTYPYMAPECWTYDSNTIAMDLYALGIICFEVLSRKLPFNGRNESEIREKHLFEPLPNILDFRRDVPIKLAQMIGKLTNKRPAERYSCTSEIINVLASISDEFLETPRTNDRLLHLANKTISEQQKKQLEGQKKASELQTKKKLLDHSIELLFQKFTDRIGEINSQLEQGKIHVQKGKSSLSVSFQGKSVQFLFFPESEIQQQIERRIKAGKDFQIQKWGFLVQEVEKTYLQKDNIILIGKAELSAGYSGASWGFNLILKKTNEQDLYGEWYIVWFNDSPLVARQQFQHYALDVPEFYQEYEYGRGNVMHVRTMVFKYLNEDDIDATLEQIL